MRIGATERADDLADLGPESAEQLTPGRIAVSLQVGGRPKPPAQVEEQYNEPWASADGLRVKGSMIS